MSINFSELSITIIINVIFTLLFIWAFFFYYFDNLASEIIQNQVNFLTDGIISPIKILGPDINDGFKDYVNNLSNTHLEEADKIVEKINKTVKYNVIISNLGLVFLVIAIVYYILSRSNNSFSINDILIKNSIILLFIALTNYVFIQYFSTKYILVNPNTVIYNIIKKIKEVVV